MSHLARLLTYSREIIIVDETVKSSKVSHEPSWTCVVSDQETPFHVNMLSAQLSPTSDIKSNEKIVSLNY